MANTIPLLIARILLALIFIVSGASKFADISGTAGMIANAGLPAANLLAILAAIFEVVGGMAVLVGFQTRNVSYLLAAFCLFTGFAFHMGVIAVPGFSDAANAMLSQFNQVGFLKNLAMAGGFLSLAAAGAGKISVDARLAA